MTEPKPAPEEARETRRESLFLAAEADHEGRRLQGRIRNISATGAFVEIAPVPEEGEELELAFRGVDHIRATVVRRTEKGVGVRFDRTIDPAACRRSVMQQPKEWGRDYVLCLREGYRPLRWQTETEVRRPGLR